MTRILLFLLFFVLLAADTLSLNLSLAPGLSVKNAFLYLILLGILIESALTRNRSLELLSISVPYGLCIFYAVFTWLVVVLLVQYPGYPTVGTFITLKGGLADHLIVFLVFFYGVLNFEDAQKLLKMLLWTVVAANVITVVDALNLPDLGLINERDDGRIGGPMGESNQYAAFLAMFLPGIAALTVIEHGLRRIIAAGGLILSLLALLMTASRGGLVAVVGGGVIGAVFVRHFIAGKTIVSTAGSLIVLAIFALGTAYVTGYGDLLYERIFAVSTSGSAYDVTSGRTFIWATALAKMLQQPVTLITGFGWDAYRYFPDFNLAPHNGYLKIFFELGAIGLFLVLFSLANVLRVARRCLRWAKSQSRILLLGFIFGFLGVLVAIVFVDLIALWLFIWAYTGVAMRLAVSQDEGAMLPAAHATFAAGISSRASPSIRRAQFDLPDK